MDIAAAVDEDGTLHVVETRTFDSDGSFNGVYWDIPTGYNPNNGQEVEVNVTSAGESTAGSLLAFQLSDSDEDGTYSISAGVISASNPSRPPQREGKVHHCL